MRNNLKQFSLPDQTISEIHELKILLCASTYSEAIRRAVHIALVLVRKKCSGN
jgi:hypothetical protein